jgi:thiamine biosynthesis lipoprotein
MEAELHFHAMGTTAHVVVMGDSRLASLARARIDELESRWSRFLPSSEVTRLNANHGAPMTVSSDTFALVASAVDAWRATGGRFDPTVLGDVVRAGYDRSFPMVLRHPQRGISFLRADCGGIIMNRATSTIALPSWVGFDPGGIGKGLAADLVVAELLAAGADGACVNIGGDLRVEGLGPNDGRWVVHIEDPGNDETIAAIAIAAGGVATSTVAKRTWVAGGTTAHHVIDPATGEPLLSALVSATALARTAAGAEVAATAALVSPPSQALAGMTDLGCDGVVTDSHGQHKRTPGFASFVIDTVNA